MSRVIGRNPMLEYEFDHLEDRQMTIIHRVLESNIAKLVLLSIVNK